MDYSLSFGAWLQRRRKVVDLTQQELAYRVGCSIDTIKKIETDMRRPSRQLAELLAVQLELTGDEALAFVKAARALLTPDRLGSPQFPGQGKEPVAQPGLDSPINPYKGLRSFQEADAADFFGREHLVQSLLNRLGETSPLARFLAVVGPSGSGKSSAIQAGLLPALRQGVLLNSDRWCYWVMFPGVRPFQELEVGLGRLADRLGGALTPTALHELLLEDELGLAHATKRILPEDGELMLVIDQFEELFTLVADETIRSRFLSSLCTAVMDPHSRLRVVVTLRADFYDRPLQYSSFGALVSRRTEAVPPLTMGELQEAIVGPAARVGVAVEPALMAMLMRDVGEQPGALPLLQYELTELFEQRQDRTLTLASYRAGGGVTTALAKHAEALYAGLDNQAQLAARQIFLRLLTLGEGVEDTRRRVSINELADVVRNEGSLDAVLDAYGAARLLTFDRDPLAHCSTVEVAHEALIRTWPRLRAWVDESRGDVRMQRVLAAAAADWRANGCEPSYLLNGSRLDGFAGWSAQTGVTLTTDEQTFLSASVHQRDAEHALEQARRQRELDQAHALVEEQQRRADEQSRAAAQLRRGAYLLAGALVLALLVAGMAAVLARNNADLATQNAAIAATAQAASINAQRNFASAESQRIAAVSTSILQRGESAELATLVALRALRTDYTPEADVALQRASRTYFGDRLFTHQTRVDAIAFAPDGRTFASGEGDGIVRMWDVQTGKELHHFQEGGDRISAIVFSTDGARLLTYDVDGVVAVWDAQGNPLRRFEHQNKLSFVAFSADSHGVWVGSSRVAQEWQIDNGAPLNRIDTGAWLPLAIAPDGSLMVLAQPTGQLQVVDMASGRVRHTMEDHTAAVIKAKFAQQGRVFLTTSADQTAILWDTASGRKLATFVGHHGPVLDADLSPDGKSVVTAGSDMVVELWDAVTGADRFRLAVHTAPVEAITFAPQGNNFLTASQDGSVRLWDTAKAVEPGTFAGQSGQLFGLDFSTDGSQLLTGSHDNTAILWDAASQRPLKTIRLEHGADTAIFAANGTEALVAGIEGGAVQLIDLRNGAELIQLNADNRVRGVALTHDGKEIISGSTDAVDIWDVASRQKIRQIPIPGGAMQVLALSPDDSHLATGSVQAQGIHLRLWNLATGKEEQEYSDPAPVNAIEFSPDGKFLISGERDNLARLWDVKSGHEIHPFVGHAGWIWNVHFSPDGKYVLTASEDRTAVLWNVANASRVRIFPGHGDAAVANAIFAPDGHSVVLSSFDGTAQRTPVDVDATVRSVCDRMLRKLTAEERQHYNILIEENTIQAFWGKGC